MNKFSHILIGVVTAATLFSGLNANAQDQTGKNSFSLSGQFRPRLEVRDGSFRPLSKGEKPAVLVSNRIRLNMAYSYSDLLTTKLSLQDVGIWGQSAPIQGVGPNGQSVGLFEAWVDLKLFKGLHTKIGRQTMDLDGGRLFSAVDWAMGGRAHDGLSVSYQSGKFKATSLFAFNQNYSTNYNNNLNNPVGNLYDPQGTQPYKSMQMIWMEYTPGKISKLSFLFANIGYQNAKGAIDTTSVYYGQTTGFNYYLNIASTSATLTGYYQFGKTPQGKNTSSYLLAGKLQQHINTKLIGTIGLDYLSGNTYGKGNTTDHAFQTLFATGHKFYGNMDYFYAGNSHGNVGLLDAYLAAGCQLSSKSKMNITGHLFQAAADVYLNGDQQGKSLGQEIDLNFAHKINDFTTVSLGYSTFFTSNTLLEVKNVSNVKSSQNWIWVSLNVQPEFFKSKF